MRAEPWAEFWQALGLVFCHFEDVGLAAFASDLEVWQRCQAEQLLLITDNRNEKTLDSLETTIRRLNTPGSLPVFTIASLDRVHAGDYAVRIVTRLYELLIGHR